MLSYLGPSQLLWHQLYILLASPAAPRLFLPDPPHCSWEGGFTPCLLPRRVEDALSGRPMSPSVCPNSVTTFPLTTVPGSCPCRQGTLEHTLSQDRCESRRVNLSRVHAVLSPHRGQQPLKQSPQVGRCVRDRSDSGWKAAAPGQCSDSGHHTSVSC